MLCLRGQLHNGFWCAVPIWWHWIMGISDLLQGHLLWSAVILLPPMTLPWAIAYPPDGKSSLLLSTFLHLPLFYISSLPLKHRGSNCSSLSSASLIYRWLKSCCIWVVCLWRYFPKIGMWKTCISSFVVYPMSGIFLYLLLNISLHFHLR